jgi:hypothetical protein
MPRAREKQERNEVNIRSVEHGATGTFKTINKYRDAHRQVSVDGYTNSPDTWSYPHIRSLLLSTRHGAWRYPQARSYCPIVTVRGDTHTRARSYCLLDTLRGYTHTLATRHITCRYPHTRSCNGSYDVESLLSATRRSKTASRPDCAHNFRLVRANSPSTTKG